MAVFPPVHEIVFWNRWRSLVVFSHMIDCQFKWSSSTRSQQVFKDTILHYWRCTDVHVMLCKFKSQWRQPSWRIWLMHFFLLLRSLVWKDYLNLAWQPRSVTLNLQAPWSVPCFSKKVLTWWMWFNYNHKMYQKLENQCAIYSIDPKLLIKVDY